MLIKPIDERAFALLAAGFSGDELQLIPAHWNDWVAPILNQKYLPGGKLRGKKLQTVRAALADKFDLTLVAILLATLLFALPAQAQQQRVYGPDGRSIGTVTTDSAGNQTFRDARGNTTGTSSTNSQGTTVYDSRGNVIGRSSRK